MLIKNIAKYCNLINKTEKKIDLQFKKVRKYSKKGIMDKNFE
jgi:hypothetical protein